LNVPKGQKEKKRRKWGEKMVKRGKKFGWEKERVYLCPIYQSEIED